MKFRNRLPRGPEDAGKGGSSLRQWLPYLYLLGACGILFRAQLLGKGLFYYRDIAQNYRPLRAVIQQEIVAGRLPLWNPFLGLGQPLLANPNHLVLHPTTLLLLFLPLDLAVSWSVILGVALALSGTYALLRQLGVTPPGAVLGACAYGFSGLFLSLGNLPNLLGAASWLPMSLFLVRRFWVRPNPPRALLAVLGVGLLLASAEVAVFFSFLLVAPALALARDGPTSERGFPPRVGRRLLQLTGVAGAGILLSAVQWIPFLELLSRSRRVSGFPYEVAAQWSFPPLRFAEFLLPGLFGPPTSMDPRQYWGLGFFETGYPFLLSVYLGPLVLLLAACSLGKGFLRMETGLGIGVGISVFLALGRYTPLHVFLYGSVPGFGTVRYPSRFLLLAQIGLAILAARGLDRILRPPRGEGGRPKAGGIALGAAGGLAGLALLAAGGAGWVSRVLGARFGSAGPTAIFQPHLEDVIRSGSFRIALICTVFCLILFLIRFRFLGRTSAAWSLVVLLGMDLLGANGSVNPVVGPGFYQQELPMVSFLQAQGGLYRVQREERPKGLRIRAPDPSVEWGYAWDRATLSRSTPAEFRIPMGYGRTTDYLDLAQQDEVFQMGGDSPFEEKIRVLCRSGIRFLLSYDAVPPGAGVREVITLGARSQPPARLYELPCALPRAFAVGGVRWAANLREAREILDSPEFQPAGEVVLSGPGPGAREKEHHAGRFPCRLAVDRPGRVEMEVQADRPGYAILLENHFPGWRAWVDGEERPLLAANGLFQAVAVPAGDHRVRFAYLPRTPLRGGFLALLGLVLAWWVIPERRSPAPGDSRGSAPAGSPIRVSRGS